jgi:hypothetical protein
MERWQKRDDELPALDRFDCSVPRLDPELTADVSLDHELKSVPSGCIVEVCRVSSDRADCVKLALDDV